MKIRAKRKIFCLVALSIFAVISLFTAALIVNYYEQKYYMDLENYLINENIIDDQIQMVTRARRLEHIPSVEPPTQEYLDK